jgi:hypothetical protein
MSVGQPTYALRTSTAATGLSIEDHVLPAYKSETEGNETRAILPHGKRRQISELERL